MMRRLSRLTKVNNRIHQDSEKPAPLSLCFLPPMKPNVRARDRFRRSSR